MLPSPTDLTYFYEIANELNFNRTAKKLNISQPSLSMAIKRLEKLLDTNLFIRHSQGVTLTRAGSQLLINVEKLLIQWGEISKNINDASEQVKGKVTVGCHSTLSPFLSNMVSQLLTQYPELEIHFQHGFATEIMQNIVEGNLDIGIITDPYPHANVIIRPLAETEFTFWMSTKHGKWLDLYAQELLIICDLQISPTQHLLNELHKSRINLPPPRFSNMNQIEAIAAMTIESEGIGILPTAYTEYYFSKQLKKIPDAPVYTKPLCLAYRSENKKVLPVQTVLNAIKNLVKSNN